MKMNILFTFICLSFSATAFARVSSWLTIFCATRHLPAENFFHKIDSLTDQDYPGVGHYYRLGSQGKIILDFSAKVDWFKNSKEANDYPDPIGDMPRRDLAQDCIKTAYENGHVHRSTSHSLNDFDGILLVNDMGATAVAWYDSLSVHVTMADGTVYVKPVIMSTVESLDHHNILAHELGHGFGVYHAGSAFDPMGFGNISRLPTSLGNTHSFFIGMHRRFLGWTEAHELQVIPYGDQQLVELTSVGDYLTQRHAGDISEVILKRPDEEYSIEYRRFISYDTNISAEGLTIHQAPIKDGEVDLRRNSTLIFPFSSNKLEPRVLLPGDSFVDPTKGLAITVKHVTPNGKWALEVINSDKPLIRKPFPAVQPSIPGRIEAEDFDVGFNTWTHFDVDPHNSGGAYRPHESVDLELTEDQGPGVNVGWIKSGEFLEYSLDVSQESQYQAHFRGAQADPAKTSLVKLYLDGKPLADINIEFTGGWHDWKTFSSKAFLLPEGKHILRVEFQNVSGLNFNYLDIK